MIADLYSPPNIHGNRMLMTKIEENNCHTVMNSLPPENHARGKVEWGVGGGFRTVMNIYMCVWFPPSNFTISIALRWLAINVYVYISSHLKAMLMVMFEGGSHTPSIGFRHLPPKGGCRKPVLGVWWEASHCLAVYCAWSINTEIPRSKGDNFKTQQSRLKEVGR